MPDTENKAETEKLKTLRASAKGSITRIKNLVDSKGNTLTLPDLECRLGILESYFKQVLSYHSSYESLSPSDSTNSTYRSDCEELYVSAKSTLMLLIAEHKKNTASPHSDLNQSIIVKPTPAQKLQQIKLPKFSGKYSEYPNFIGIFNKSVHLNEHYEIIEKCNLLVASLDGLAKNAVREFQISEENYPKILKHLQNRFDNKTLMFQELISELFELPKVTKSNANNLRSLVDNVNAIFSSMKSIGSCEDIANSMIIYVVMNKLDPDSQSKWEDSIDFTTLLKWEDCSKILSKRCQFLECREAKPSTSQYQSKNLIVKNNTKNSYRSNSTVLSVSNTQTHNSVSCAFCNNSGHTIYKCTKFSELSVIDRFNKIKNLSLCINCLNKGHSVKKCTSSKCRVCTGPHHTLLHRYNNSSLLSTGGNDPDSNSSLTSSTVSPSQSPNSFSSNNNALCGIIESNKVILATALVQILDSSGVFKPVRALLDSGSQLNFITDRLVHSLCLKKTKINTDISGIANANVKVRFSTNSVVKSRINDFKLHLDMLVLPSIAGVMPDSHIPIDSWNIPQNIELADPQFYIQQNVDILLGAETFFELLAVGQIKLGEDMPLLQKTLLGWIVSGKYKSNCIASSHNALSSVVKNDDVESFQELHELVKDFWKIECFENSSVIPTEEQSLCENFFNSTVNQTPSGRIIVKLPFKKHFSELGLSRAIAEKRFYSLEKRLNRDLNLKGQYSDFLKEYLELDHMELVPKNQEYLVKFYLPHHCVLKPDSSSTKVRVVFDGSCKTTSNLSLNDILMVGPTVQEDLYSILIRFRCKKYALKADICKMYRQFLIDKEDSYFQCILWRSDVSKELETYRLKTVTYGTSSASYLATKSLCHIASINREKYPEGSAIISKDFYVDDLLTGGETLQEITTIKKQVDNILNSAGLQLKKWYSNNSTFLERIPAADQEKLISINGTSIVKALGICWQPSADQLKFCISENLFPSSKITKRTVLSDLSKLFDPVGLINPIIVKSKVFLQNLWLLKLDWDESLPQDLHTEWQQFRKDVYLLNEVSIPRFVMCRKDIVKTEIHGFCDASSKAYGCCVYLRCIDIDGDIHVNLLTAKSRIAPIKTQSIPRLELCAASLLANLLHKLFQFIQVKVDETILWTDSEIVLSWLSAHPSNWVVFVANRVSQIQQLTENYTWRHVNSKANAADILSRGSNVQELIEVGWFIGPDFLKKSVNHWPIKKAKNNSIDNVPEKRSSNQCSLTIQDSNDYLYNILLKFSSYNKIVDTFAYIIRFIKNSKITTNTQIRCRGILTFAERNFALLKIVEILQKKYFNSEIKTLLKHKEISPKSVMKNFNPLLEMEESVLLLKVGGRLKNADISHSAKYPIFLPNNDHFVKLLIEHLHIINLHAGSQALLAIIRQRFWLTNGRRTVSRIVQKCLRCFKFKPKLSQQIMGDLPKSRVEPSRAFYTTGVDFCGPVMVSYGLRGRQLYKAYIAVFVCFTTHAVHLDLVSSLSSDAFIACLKRFISRRGLCRHLYCDNATNFVGARHQLRDLHEKFKEQEFTNEILRWSSRQQIEFHHIPARSPHFGGLWEAAVKLAKFHLNRCCLNLRFTFEEMVTLLTQIESCLNSRPITPLSSDPNDDQALTPGHFLVGGPLNAIPEPSYDMTTNISTIKRFHRISFVQQKFWIRWSKEYLSNLQRRQKWCSQSNNLKTGVIVLMGGDNLPPQQWSVGRIVKLYPGRDNKVRVVDVRCRGKIFRRQIHTLAPLPIED